MKGKLNFLTDPKSAVKKYCCMSNATGTIFKVQSVIPLLLWSFIVTSQPSIIKQFRFFQNKKGLFCNFKTWFDLNVPKIKKPWRNDILNRYTHSDKGTHLKKVALIAIMDTFLGWNSGIFFDHSCRFTLASKPWRILYLKFTERLMVRDMLKRPYYVSTEIFFNG